MNTIIFYAAQESGLTVTKPLPLFLRHPYITVKHENLPAQNVDRS